MLELLVILFFNFYKILLFSADWDLGTMLIAVINNCKKRLLCLRKQFHPSIKDHNT